MKKKSFSTINAGLNDIINIKLRLKRRGKKKFSKKFTPKIRSHKTRNSMKRIRTRCRTINPNTKWVPLFDYLAQLE